MSLAAPAGLPARAVLQPAGLYLELRDIAPSELIEPFMQETVDRLQAPRSLLEITAASMVQVSAASAPAGIVFHVARCGSTLVSQLLKQQGGAVVYAEPLPFNELLRLAPQTDPTVLIAALRSLGAAFARHAGRPYVLKLSSWNTLYGDLVATAFPRTPWALCVRDPVEVCVSLLRQRPGWLREPPLFPRVHDATGATPGPERLVADHFAAFCDAAERLPVERGLLLRYESLPDAIWARLGPHFNLTIDDEARARMAAAARDHSKSPPGRPSVFTADSERKRAEASPELLTEVERVARPAYARLLAGHRAPAPSPAQA
jgi:hypothetical protein